MSALWGIVVQPEENLRSILLKLIILLAVLGGVVCYVFLSRVGVPLGQNDVCKLFSAHPSWYRATRSACTTSPCSRWRSCSRWVATSRTQTRGSAANVHAMRAIVHGRRSAHAHRFAFIEYF